MTPYFLFVGALHTGKILLIVAGSAVNTKIYQELPFLAAVNYVSLATGYLWLARRTSRCH